MAKSKLGKKMGFDLAEYCRDLKTQIAHKVAGIEVCSEDIAKEKARLLSYEVELGELIEELTEAAGRQAVDIYRHKQSILDAINKPKRRRGRPAKVA